MSHTPGPCETLARLAIQSERYRDDPDFREAVDAVLGHRMFDRAPAMLEALQSLVRNERPWFPGQREIHVAIVEQARAILASLES